MDKSAHSTSVPQLYKKGLSQAAIARQLGISRQRVWQLLHGQGLVGSDKPSPQLRREQLPQLLRQGLSNTQIAKRLGVGYSTIKQDLSQLPDRTALLEARRMAQPSWRRRKQVPDLIREGLATPDIARRLGVGITTIQRDVLALGLPKSLARKRLANARAAFERKRKEAVERKAGQLSKPSKP
jgi:DNA-binding NarL/FixJ family response regulator